MELPQDNNTDSQTINRLKLIETKQSHTIIHNCDDIRRFANTFNVDKRHLALCLYLTMRRKYCTNNPYNLNYSERRDSKNATISQGTKILNRVIIPGGPNFERRLYQNILRLETPIGSYTDNDINVPNHALALYVMIDPKDTIKAMSKVLSKCVDSLTNYSKSEELPNAYSLYREEIPKSNSTGQKYKQIDLDTKDLKQVEETHALLVKLNITIIMCIETHGGFHIIYSADTDKDINRALYEFKQKTAFKKDNIDGKTVTDYWFSITHQPNVIMPGTYQGGFPARIINLNDWITHASR